MLHMHTKHWRNLKRGRSKSDKRDPLRILIHLSQGMFSSEKRSDTARLQCRLIPIQPPYPKYYDHDVILLTYHDLFLFFPLLFFTFDPLDTCLDPDAIVGTSGAGNLKRKGVKESRRAK